MGVHNLWKILEPVKELVKLETLKGQTLAVDLSVWICDAQGVKQMQGVVAKPHLRNLFFRVSHLLQLGVNLIFVIDGEAPELKWEAMMARQKARFGQHGQAGFKGGKPAKKPGRSHFKRLVNECCQMLDYLGVPYVQSVGEAEAFCALLNKLGFADSVVTQDGDAFLYGATKVYKNFTISGKDAQIESYSMAHVSAKLHLNRDKLIALGLLLGCDYVPKGVPGVGKETAMKFMMTYKETTSILERFREWRRRPSSHTASAIEVKLKAKALAVNEFPFEKVIEEFLVIKDKCPKKSLIWTKPQIRKLYEFNEKMEWPMAYTNEKIIPLLTLHDMRTKLKNYNHRPEPKPSCIVKARIRQFVPCFEVQWEKLECDAEPENTADVYTTLEEKDLFTTCYPHLVSAFEEQAPKKPTKRHKNAKKSVEESETSSPQPDALVDALKMSDLQIVDTHKNQRDLAYRYSTATDIKLSSKSVSRYSKEPDYSEGDLEDVSVLDLDSYHIEERTKTQTKYTSALACSDMVPSTGAGNQQRKFEQNDSREKDHDFLSQAQQHNRMSRVEDDEALDEPEDLVTRLRRLRLQSSESPKPNTKHDKEIHRYSLDDSENRCLARKSTNRKSDKGESRLKNGTCAQLHVSVAEGEKTRTPFGFSSQNSDDSLIIIESDQLDAIESESKTNLSYGSVTDSFLVKANKTLDTAKSVQSCNFSSVSDSILLKGDIDVVQSPYSQAICTEFSDSSFLSESQLYGDEIESRIGAISLGSVETNGNIVSKCTSTSAQGEDIEMSVSVNSPVLCGHESLLDEGTQLSEDVGTTVADHASCGDSTSIFEKETTIYDDDRINSDMMKGSILEKETRLYDDVESSVSNGTCSSIFEKETRLYEDVESSVSNGTCSSIFEKETRLYEDGEISVTDSSSLEAKETRLYEDVESSVSNGTCSSIFEKETRLCEDGESSVADSGSLEAKETRLYEDVESSVSNGTCSSIFEKETRLYEDGESSITDSGSLEVNVTRLYEDVGSDMPEVELSAAIEASIYDTYDSSEMSVSDIFSPACCNKASLSSDSIAEKDTQICEDENSSSFCSPANVTRLYEDVGSDMPEVELSAAFQTSIYDTYDSSEMSVSDIFSPACCNKASLSSDSIAEKDTQICEDENSSSFCSPANVTRLYEDVGSDMPEVELSAAFQTSIYDTNDSSEMSVSDIFSPACYKNLIREERSTSGCCKTNETSSGMSPKISSEYIVKQEPISPIVWAFPIHMASMKVKTEKLDVASALCVESLSVRSHQIVEAKQDADQVQRVSGEQQTNSTVHEQQNDDTLEGQKSNSAVERQEGNSTIEEPQSNSTFEEQENNSTVEEQESNNTVERQQSNSTVQEQQSNSTVQEQRSNTNSAVEGQRSNSAVQEQQSNSTVEGQEGNSTVEGQQNNSTVQQQQSNSTVQEQQSNSYVQEQQNDSTLEEQKGSSTVEGERNDSAVEEQQCNSTVEEQQSNSTIERQQNNSTVEEQQINRIVEEQQSNSTVKEQQNNSTVEGSQSNSALEEHHSISTVQEQQKDSNVEEQQSNSTVQERQNNSTVEEHQGNSAVETLGTLSGQGSSDMTSRNQSLEQHLLLNDTVVSSAPGCEEDMDVLVDEPEAAGGVAAFDPQTDENAEMVDAGQDGVCPSPEIGVVTRRGRPKKKMGKKKKPTKKSKKRNLNNAGDLSSILRQLATSASCPGSPAVSGPLDENSLLGLVKGVLTPRTANTSASELSAIPTDSLLRGLLDTIDFETDAGAPAKIPQRQSGLTNTPLERMQNNVQTPKRDLSSIPSDSLLGDLLAQVGLKPSAGLSTPLANDNVKQNKAYTPNRDLRSVLFANQLEGLSTSKQGLKTNATYTVSTPLGNEKQNESLRVCVMKKFEGTPLSTQKSLLTKPLGATGMSQPKTPGANGSLLSDDQLRHLLREIGTPILNLEKENVQPYTGAVGSTPNGDVDVSLLMNLVSALSSVKKRKPAKKGKKKRKTKKVMRPVPLLLLDGDE